MNIFLAKLARLDLDAANYVRKGLAERSIHNCADLSGMFTWVNTPQGYFYWQNLNNQIRELPDKTALGNVF